MKISKLTTCLVTLLILMATYGPAAAQSPPTQAEAQTALKQKKYTQAAQLFSNAGYSYYHNKNYKKAAQSFDDGIAALKKSKETQTQLMAGLLTEAGRCHNLAGQPATAIERFETAVPLYQNINQPKAHFEMLLDLAQTYVEQKNHRKSISYLLQALEIANQLNNLRGQMTANLLLAEAYQETWRRKKSLFYMKTYLDQLQVLKKEEMAKREAANQQRLNNIVQQNQQKVNQLESIADTLHQLNQQKEQKLQITSRALDSTSIVAQLNQMKLDQMEREKELRDRAIKAEKQRQRILIISIIAGLNLVIIIAFIIYRSYRNSQRANQQLNQRNQQIEKQKLTIEAEREKSDKLLLNILPPEVANELKKVGKYQPKSYRKVTVLFTDFKGFTQISEQLTAEEIIKELGYCFEAFDKICDKYNLEKIKTIGDAYMAAAGVPTENETNPTDTVLAAIEMQQFMEKWKEQKIKEKKPVWGLRLGINTGPLVAGVIGSNKFAYDIWGDTVNTASRMESSGEVGKINISESTYQLVKAKFKCQHRGKLPAKNKGEINMYFVEGTA